MKGGDAGVGATEPAFEMGDERGDAERLHDWQIGGEAAGGEPCHFILCALREHGTEAGFSGGVQRCARRHEDEAADIVAVGDAALSLGLPEGERAACAADDFQRAVQAGGIPCAQAGGHCRIFVRQCVRGLCSGQGAHGGADMGRNFGQRGEAVEQGFDIEACAADDERQATFSKGCGNGGPGKGCVASGVGGFGAIENAEQAVGDGGFFGRRGACGEDAKIGVELAGVGIDDGGV